MKKQVRIRKALPGETPGYYNKTAKFLKKAKMGMEVSSSIMDPARINQIKDNVYISLKNDSTPDLVYNQLINEYALDESTSVMIIKEALSKLAQEGYVDPDSEEEDTSTNPEEVPATPNPTTNEDAERAASDAEQDQLAMSDSGYYDEEEALNNDTSHLENEQDEQEQAFRYGGYFANGGTEEYDDYEDQYSNQQLGREQTVMGQYENPGAMSSEKPFSIEDLIAVTPGMQDQSAFPDLSSYIGNYQEQDYEAQEYLPQAQTGWAGKLAELSKYIPKIPTNLTSSITPMTNFSTARKLVPLVTGVGQAMTKIPYLGAKFKPKLATSFTQNRTELWNVLNGASPKLGTFSQNGSLIGGADGSLQADKLLLYQDDVHKIIDNIKFGKTNFTLDDINPIAQEDGLVSGIYPLDTKVIGGTDDAGNTFFELKHTFGPNQRLPFGTTPAKAKEVTFKNRFYFNNDPDTGELKVFDPLGNSLMSGVQTKSKVTRPIGTSVLGLTRDLFTKDVSFTNNTNLETPFPNYFYQNKGARKVDMTGLPPRTVADMGFLGKAGRALEWGTTSGLNQLFRTHSKNVEKVDYPVYGYANMALGPNIQNPASVPFSQTASDIKNAINYKWRLGLKTTLGLGAAYYLGDKIYDAYNECQCTDPNAPNFMAPDAVGNCPCNTDVGPSRVLDPNGIQEENTVDPSLLKHDVDTLYQGEYSDPEDDFKKGGITKNRFIKRMTSMYADGGPSTEGAPGQGKRTDTLTDEISNTKISFLNTLKNNSNKAISEDIYKNAQGNPQILNMLTKDGYKENLSEDAFDTTPLSTDPTAAFGGFIDMDAAEPLTKFVYGGDDEEEYYEPYGLEQAQRGITIQNKAGESRGMQDKMNYQEWADSEALNRNSEREDWEADNPDGDYDTDVDIDDRTYDDYENFYDQSLNEFSNEGEEDLKMDEPRVGETNSAYLLRTTGNPGYYLNNDTWNGTQWVKTNQTKCGPGMAYSNTYKKCIPISKINYIPKEVRGQSGWRNNLLPWNPILHSQGSWVKQKGTPYYLNDGRSYNGLVPDKPMASYTTKKGLLGGRKKWIDIYEVDGDGNGSGVPMQDLGKLEEMLGHKKGYGKNNSNDFRLTKKVVKNALEDGWIKNYGNNDSKPERTNRKDYLNSKLQEDSWNKSHWDELSNSEQRQARKLYTFENEDERNLADKIRFRAQGTKFSESGRTKQIKQFGGAFQLGNGFSNGVGQNTSSYNPYSQQSQFENGLFGSPAPSGLPPKQQNLFGSITPTATGSYAETRDTGHTLGSKGEEIIPQGPESEKEKQYMGIERKRKNVYGFDGEAAVNVGNAIGNGILGTINNIQQAPKQRKQLLDIADPINQQGMVNSVDSGDQVDFGSFMGYRTPEQGSDRNSRATYGNYANTNLGRYGGYMQNGGYANPFYEEDDEVEMTPYELEQYLAAGGQVEYL
jgi:hypothetical protein